MREWASQITSIQPGEMKTYGVDQKEIIRSYSFEEAVFLLLSGRQPDPVEKDLLRSVLLSGLSHGITGQSTLAVRMAADCRSSFLHALIAGFSTGAGIYHQGGLEAAMHELRQLALLPDEDLRGHVEMRVREGKRVIGFGHRFHKTSEPRAAALMEAVDRNSYEGVYTKLARRVEAILGEFKPLPMNIEGARGSILLDLGFEPSIAHLFIILGRSTMFAAAYLERLAENTRPLPKLKIFDL